MMLRTAQQRKTLCRSCPVARVADLVGDSCSLLILRDLLERPMRFGELQESLSGISSRTLVKKLKRLEKEGLMRRKVVRTHSSGVLYSLTKRGDALGPVVEAMRKYGKRHL